MKFKNALSELLSDRVWALQEKISSTSQAAIINAVSYGIAFKNNNLNYLLNRTNRPRKAELRPI